MSVKFSEANNGQQSLVWSNMGKKTKLKREQELQPSGPLCALS